LFFVCGKDILELVHFMLLIFLVLYAHRKIKPRENCSKMRRKSKNIFIEEKIGKKERDRKAKNG